MTLKKRRKTRKVRGVNGAVELHESQPGKQVVQLGQGETVVLLSEEKPEDLLETQLRNRKRHGEDIA